jgi:AcrR family transcriptional regulator
VCETGHHRGACSIGAPHADGEEAMTDHRGADRRVQKTRTLLHGALASLVHEKSYDDIIVKEILARANVGRSTFYAHYRDKDELLDGGIRELLHVDVACPPERASGAAERLLRFSLPFLTHIERFRRDGRLPLGGRASAVVHEHLRCVLVSILADELRAEYRRRAASATDFPADLLACHVASGFVVTLDWWLEHHALSAPEVDAHFHALVEPVLRQALGD